MCKNAYSAADRAMRYRHMRVGDDVHFGAVVRSGDTSRLSELYLKKWEKHTVRKNRTTEIQSDYNKK